MPEKKSTRTGRRPASKTTRTRKGASGPEKERPKGGGSEKKVTEESNQQPDQIGAILTKGLDLAEASISLGLNLVSRLGSVAQENLIDRLFGVVPSSSSASETESDSGSPPEPSAPEERTGEDNAADNYGVINRMPLIPGGPVKVSFSINNDSYNTPKKVRLRLVGFTGERQGMVIEGKDFSIRPVTKSIAPMDFDKFTLSGVIPESLVSDVYSGWIIVQAEKEFRIPVRLAVSGV